MADRPLPAALHLLARVFPFHQRPWLAFFRLTFVSTAILLLLIANLIISLNEAKPVIAVDYLKPINERTEKIPVKHRAWLVYRQLLIDLDLVNWNSPTNNLLRLTIREDAARDEKIAAWVKAHESEIERLRQAAALPAIGIIFSPGSVNPIAPEEQILAPLLTHSSEAREGPMCYAISPYWHIGSRLVYVLHADLEVAIRSRDEARCLADLRAIDGLASQIAAIPFACTVIDRNRIFTWTCSELQDEMLRDPDALPESVMRYVIDRLNTWELFSHYERALETERDVLRDIMQRVYSDDGAGNGRITATALRIVPLWEELTMYSDDGAIPQSVYLSIARPNSPVPGSLRLAITAMLTPGRAELARKADQWWEIARAEMRIPLHEMVWGKIDTEKELHKDTFEEQRYFIMRRIFMWVDHFRSYNGSWSATRDATQIALAMHLYRRAHGTWPATLEALVPEYLAMLPRDPVTKDALHYKITDGKPLVYSVGVDRKDNGGVPSAQPYRARSWNPEFAKEPDAQGDWLYWPPAPR